MCVKKERKAGRKKKAGKAGKIKACASSRQAGRQQKCVWCAKVGWGKHDALGTVRVCKGVVG